MKRMILVVLLLACAGRDSMTNQSASNTTVEAAVSPRVRDCYELTTVTLNNMTLVDSMYYPKSVPMYNIHGIEMYTNYDNVIRQTIRQIKCPG